MQQDAVAVADEKLRVSDGAGAVAATAVHDENRRAVPRRSVPAGKLDAVGRLEADLAVVGAGRGADGLAVLVGLDERDAHRHDDVEDTEQPDRDGEDAVGPAPPVRGGAVTAVQPRIAIASPLSATPAAATSAPVTSLVAAP